MTSFYEHGLEQAVDIEGWAVFAGAEGETPRFVAFFVYEADAETFIEFPDSEDPERTRVFEPAIVRAILTQDLGLVAENDTDLKTHEDLRRRIEKYRIAESLADDTGIVR